MSATSVEPAVPSVEELERGLVAIGSTRLGSDLRGARVVHRRRNWYTSTFATELVTVRTGDAKTVVFCKHGEDYVDEQAGLRRGPAYEAEVYANVVSSLEDVAPRWYGSFEGDHGTTVVISFLAHARRANEAGTPGAVVGAAARLGMLHRRCVGIADQRCLADLNRYGPGHHALWIERPDRIEPELPLSRALEPMLQHRSRVAEILCAAEPTFVHGELFPSNVLLSNGDVAFVDWESAGIGPGEIDLAALTVGSWAEEVREACEQAYFHERWGLPPSGHAEVLAAARLYILMLLASHWAHCAAQPDVEGWFEQQVAQSARALERSA